MLELCHHEHDMQYASYAYKDDPQWYHPIDGTLKDFPQFTHEQIRRDKWNYTKLCLLELNICTEILLDKYCPLKMAIWYMTQITAEHEFGT
jgi:hypothetical protein